MPPLRLCWFRTPRSGYDNDKDFRTFVQAKCLECKLDAEPLRTAGKTAQGEWLLVSCINGNSVEAAEMSDHVSIPHFLALSQKAERQGWVLFKRYISCMLRIEKCSFRKIFDVAPG